MVWVSACPSIDLQSCCYFTLALLLDKLGQYFWILNLSTPVLATWTPFILFYFSVASPLAPLGFGSSYLLYHDSIDLLSSINLWSSLTSCDLSLVLFVVMCLYLILSYSYYFVGLLEKKTEKSMRSIQHFFTSGCNNLRSTAIGLSYFLLTLKHKKMNQLLS